jgi:hypothetical protein
MRICRVGLAVLGWILASCDDSARPDARMSELGLHDKSVADLLRDSPGSKDARDQHAVDQGPVVSPCVPLPDPAKLYSTPVVALIAKHNTQAAQVLYYNNFEHNTTGAYKESEWQADWNQPTWENNFAKNAAIGSDGGGKFLRVSYPLAGGTSGSGVKWRSLLATSCQELYLGYRIRFHAAWNGSKDGGKLPGLAGNIHPYVAPGVDAAARHKKSIDTPAGGSCTSACPTGGTCNLGYCLAPTTGFSNRLMFKSGAANTVYFYSYYYNKFEHAISYCPPPYTDANCQYGMSMDWSSVNTAPGSWHTYVMRVAMNEVGKKNGLIEGFFDGKLVAQRSDIELVSSTGNSFAADQIMFETFFGGSNGPVKDEIADFDDIVVWTYTNASGEVTGRTPSAAGRSITLP